MSEMREPDEGPADVRRCARCGARTPDAELWAVLVPDVLGSCETVELRCSRCAAE
jgi:hypothetical protein